MKKITAVVPVRKGSVRVKNKNIKPFANSNLLKIKIEQLKKIPSIEKIVVSSNCHEMLKIAQDLDVIPHMREEYYASSEVNNSDFFRNLAESIDAEYLMYAPVTCPLISQTTYMECIKMFQDKDINNVVTTSPVKHHMWIDGRPLNYKIEESPNSQDLPDIYKITYGVCLISREDMIQYSNIVTASPKFYILDEIESLDIDTEFDFMVAEMIYNRLCNQ